MREAIPLVEQLQAGGEAVWLFQNERAAVRLAEMEIDHDLGIAVLLIHYSDMNASDPVFANLETGALRMEPKLAGEGVAISAHLLISIRPTNPTQDTYVTLLEDVPGLGRTKITPFLKAIFRLSSDFHFNGDDGKERKCRPVPDMVGHVSRRLRDDLEGGVLNGFELVKYRHVNGEFDEAGFLEEKTRIVQVAVTQPLTGKPAVDLINLVKARALNAGYADMKVKFKRAEGPQKSVVVGTGREDAGDALSVNSTFLKVEEPLAQCSDAIRPDVVQKMKAMLVADRDGIEYEEEQPDGVDYDADANAV
jgi:hypothetical protein